MATRGQQSPWNNSELKLKCKKIKIGKREKFHAHNSIFLANKFFIAFHFDVQLHTTSSPQTRTTKMAYSVVISLHLSLEMHSLMVRSFWPSSSTEGYSVQWGKPWWRVSLTRLALIFYQWKRRDSGTQKKKKCLKEVLRQTSVHFFTANKRLNTQKTNLCYLNSGLYKRHSSLWTKH